MEMEGIETTQYIEKKILLMIQNYMYNFIDISLPLYVFSLQEREKGFQCG